jgi:7-cyano-7-deazaguanine reductase
MRVPEFTCLCPKTGQPDFATIHIAYVPGEKCVELKSLKLYLWSYRNQGAFHEAVTNTLLNDLASSCQPRFMRITAEFYVRGGIYTTVIAEHRDPDWVAPAPVTLP